LIESVRAFKTSPSKLVNVDQTKRLSLISNLTIPSDATIDSIEGAGIQVTDLSDSKNLSSQKNVKKPVKKKLFKKVDSEDDFGDSKSME